MSCKLSFSTRHADHFLFFRIKNPLSDIPKDKLLDDVEHFARENDLMDILPHMNKGALVAKSPRDFESLEELDEADKEVLRNEVLHRWRLPWALYYTIILNSIAAAIQGWDQTGTQILYFYYLRIK